MHVYDHILQRTRQPYPSELKDLYRTLFGIECAESESEEDLMNRAFERCNDPIFVGSAYNIVYVLWNKRRVERLRPLDEYVTDEWLKKAMGRCPVLRTGDPLTNPRILELRARLNGEFQGAVAQGLFEVSSVNSRTYLTCFLRARGSRRLDHTQLFITLWMREDTGAQYVAVYRDSEYIGAYEVGLHPEGPRVFVGNYVDKDPQLTGHFRDVIADALSDILRLT